MPVSEVREALYKYAKMRLFVTGRTPPRGSGLDNEWNHLSDVFTQKAIKDTLIRDYIKKEGLVDGRYTISLKKVKEIFFDPYPVQTAIDAGLKPQNARD